MKVSFPPRPPRTPRALYHVRAVGWPRPRRKTPTVVRTVCVGWARMAGVVLWLEMLGYRCAVRRLPT